MYFVLGSLYYSTASSGSLQLVSFPCDFVTCQRYLCLQEASQLYNQHLDPSPFFQPPVMPYRFRPLERLVLTAIDMRVSPRKSNPRQLDIHAYSYVITRLFTHVDKELFNRIFNAQRGRQYSFQSGFPVISTYSQGEMCLKSLDLFLNQFTELQRGNGGKNWKDNKYMKYVFARSLLISYIKN